MSDELLLYGNANWTSPYVFSAFVVLKEKGLPFRLELLDLEKGEHQRPPYEASSFTGRVPALRHGDVWIAESSAIDEYLEEVFPPPTHAALYPEAPKARAKVRMIQAFVRSDLLALREERPTSTFFGKVRPKPFTPAGKAAAERLLRVADRFLPEGAQHVAGAFTIADADLALLLQRLVYNGDGCTDKLAEYANRIFQRASIREWLSHTPWKD